MGYAGTPGMVWGWIIAMIFIQCVAMGMAELCSAMPTSGGKYAFLSRCSVSDGADDCERSLLCSSSVGAARIWAASSMDHWLEQLAVPSYRRTKRGVSL